MKRFNLIALIVMVAVSVTFAQQTEPPKGQPAKQLEKPQDKPQGEAADDGSSDQIYREVTLEDFENTPYTDQNISISETKGQKASIQIRSDYPAPIRNSKKYLGIKVHGTSKDTAVIKPPKEIPINEYCQSISIWVYGKNFSGELIAIMRDAKGQIKRLTFGKLNFLGWRKLTAIIPKDFAQEDKFLAQPKTIAIVRFNYQPGRTGTLKDEDWDYFYIDDITAKVRKKYIDKQNDNW